MAAAFKEWALVCESLGCGKQSIIIRKGGIAEGREGFAFRHEEFVLFPTWFHAQLAQTTLPPDTPVPPAPEDEVEIRFVAQVEWSGLVSDKPVLDRLREFHILASSVIDERFVYDEPRGVHVAFVRVFRLDPPQRIPMEKRFGGCRSWIDLPDFDDCAMVSVLSDEEHATRKAVFFGIVGQ